MISVPDFNFSLVADRIKQELYLPLEETPTDEDDPVPLKWIAEQSGIGVSILRDKRKKYAKLLGEPTFKSSGKPSLWDRGAAQSFIKIHGQSRSAT